MPDEAESQINQWGSKMGLRIDVMAALAYALGPISGESRISIGRATGNNLLRTALLFLILETQNDYVRFHGKCVHPFRPA